MRKKSGTVRYTAKQIKAKIARDEDRTNWEKIDAVTGAKLEESIRGDVWHWLRLDHGQIAAAFPCDPGWGLWPLAEAAIAGGPVEDVDLIRLSCGLPCAGLDL